MIDGCQERTVNRNFGVGGIERVVSEETDGGFRKERGWFRRRERVVVKRNLDGRERREDARRTCEQNFGVGKMERMVLAEGQGKFGRGDEEKTDNRKCGEGDSEAESG